ncbi:hypothetical protein PPTG_06811 [Phytophthora nicotianae INRA-310]|uniref:PiggyBac transposable element-derived protein domain-containing protein n=1 Tax=Phytophthora nicotianae (strain INRA-310) TaxID=761204 RepID=W2QRI0_PHYN3|nr:hypothetical protein PPTG_06811 [Phytophthora nicotianae INRA-310]ETN15566.1 hypothetical protein PPTG_06811 [Phytophthora nicotianae INRA-310]
MSESESNSDQSASDSGVAGDSSTAWKFIDEPSPQLHVEDVEAFLLSKARTEANRVAKKLLVRIFGTEHRLPSDRHVNSSLAQSAFVSRSDLLKFLQVELWLAFYSVSPSNFYERSNKQYYPPVKSVMPSKRYFAILRAFGKPNAEDDVSSTHWKVPFQHDPNLSHAMDELRRLCSRFGFVSEVSIAKLDDDLLRLRSSAVDDLGLTRTRNPKNGQRISIQGSQQANSGVWGSDYWNTQEEFKFSFHIWGSSKKNTKNLSVSKAMGARQH